MQKYLSLGILALMGLLSIYFYYMYYPIHGEKKDFMLIYIIIISLIYGSIKLVSVLIDDTKTEINVGKLILFFLFQLFVVCICFFTFNGGEIGYGIALFFKVLFFLVPVVLLWINFYCLGDTVLKYRKYFGIENKNIQILSSLGTGFIIFILAVFYCISIGEYSAVSISTIGIASLIIGYKSWFQVLLGCKKTLRTYSHDLRDRASFSERYNTGLIIDELHYIVITFLISVNLVSVFRPFPIGWDDLGAYMNYPKLLSGAGEHLALGKMYLWELYTGIGFLFGSQTLAFYLNSVSGIVAAIVLYLAISSFTKNKKTSFDLALFSSMILLALPMVVFQLAKDMKLDLGLLSISIIAMSLFYEIIFGKNKVHLAVYVLLGVLIGTAFAIKVTSLLLLLGVLASFFYVSYGVGGFFSFVGIFLGVFSYLNLWGMMNVVIPQDSQSLRIFALMSLLIGVSIFVGSNILQKKSMPDFVKLCQRVGLVLIGFVAILAPWGLKNISEVPEGKNIQVSNIISGDSSFYKPDYTTILSEEKISEIQDKTKGLSHTGTTNNEDFGRYFGYEQGINNYLKLPWNLTFQTNQRGEFTEISYIFFALLPALFLFLPYRKDIYMLPVVGVILISLAYFIPGSISSTISNLFGNIRLPMGYGVIGLIALAPFVYFHFALDKTNKITQIFLVNLAFSSVYIGLWTVSAFGIVWYGILMYFAMLLMISLCMLHIDSQDENRVAYASYIVLVIVWVYILQSAVPHGVTNLKTAGYPDYKLGGMSEEGALILFHPEYFSILFELNIGDEYKQDMFIEYRNELLSIVDATPFSQAILPKIQSTKDMLSFHELMLQLERFDFKDRSVNTTIESLKERLYKDIIYVDEKKNTKKIHRIGTFLKYYISENNIRIYEDSLLTKFDDYIYDVDSNVSIERLKKLDVGYILLDINAATIDRDERKSLTQRYEKILELATNPKLQLVETDSVCLKVALDTYENDKDMDSYIKLAGVNYSYKTSSKVKKETCINKIMRIMSSQEELAEHPYLYRHLNYLVDSKVALNDIPAVKQTLSKIIPNGYKVLFKISE